MSTEHRVRFVGSGGQGIALAALLLAEGAVRAGKNATHSQAYGPASRGGASKADVIVADAAIAYPIAEHLDALVALTQLGCDRYLGDLEDGGLLLVDAERVLPAPRRGVRVVAVPILSSAKRELGRVLGANLVALGALVELTAIVPHEAVERAIEARRPGGSTERALRAFRAGRALAGIGNEAVTM